MPRQTSQLSDAFVRTVKPADNEKNYGDGQGLFLRVKISGGKLWIFNYYHPYTKKRVYLSLGVYPDISLKRARELRAEAKNLLSKGIDPKEARVEREQREQTAHANTLKKVFEQWLAVKKNQVTEDYATDIARSLENHVFPHLGEYPIHKVTAAQTITALKPIAAKGHFETIKRLCQRLNEIMVYATNAGIIEHNPLSGIGKAFSKPDVSHMPTLAPEQLPELMNALSMASIKLTTRCLIAWQLHTMTRPSEAAGARWDEINEKQATWVIPAERMKKRKIHIIPLTRESMVLLEIMRPISGHTPFIFPGDRNPNRPTHSQTANMALKRMGFEKNLVSHGLRALASTTLNEHGFDPDLIESALAHTDKNSVRKAYNRAEYVERRREMMQWWSNRIAEACHVAPIPFFNQFGQLNPV